MNRRFLLKAAGVAVASAWLPGLALARARPKIFVITYRGATAMDKAFIEHLKGTDLAPEFIVRDVNQQIERMVALRDEIRATKPDLIFTWGTNVTEAVVGRLDAIDPKLHIADIPVVFGLVAAPVTAKLVPSLAGSGRNLTGVFHVAASDVQLRAIRSYRPFSKLGVIYTPTENNSKAIIGELRAIAAAQNFELLAEPFPLENGKPSGATAAELVQSLKARGAQWLYLPPDSFLGTQAKDRVIPAAHALGLPTFAATEQLIKAGALAGLVSRYAAIGAFAGYKAEQILRGTAPRDIPIETLTRYSYLVNFKVAQELKCVPPLSMFSYLESVQG